MADEGAPKKQSWRQTFVGWHKDDDKLWREIYARTVATLLAAFIAYMIALAAGQVSAQPLRVIGLFTAIALILGLLYFWFFDLLGTSANSSRKESALELGMSIWAALLLYAGIVGSLCLYFQENMFATFGWPWALGTVVIGVVIKATAIRLAS